MSDESGTLTTGLSRFAIRIALLFAGAFVAELMGPSRRRLHGNRNRRRHVSRYCAWLTDGGLEDD
jgi:hypothetical protein